jgi:hypothetical protein
VTRLSSYELNQAFVAALGDHVVHVDDFRAAALTLELAPPLPKELRVYLFNATNPPGGRQTPEHKIQLIAPGQHPGEPGNFDFSDGRSVVVAGKVEDQEIFVLWDASLYRDFGYSANVQVRTATIEQADTNHAIATQSRRTQLGDETVIVAPSALLADATMLRAELAGQPYVKADFNREVQASTGRSRGAVEYKFQNISAVLRDTGLPYVLGYRPLPNLQSALRAEVERFLARDREVQRVIEEMPAPDVPPTVQLVEVDPPVIAPPSTGGHGRITTVATDYLERHARNRDVGLMGERLVVEHERAWLSAHGRPDLAKQVVHVPSTLGDGAGYDVSSFLLDGSPHHIEVKATRGSITAPFFLSASELGYAREQPEAYSIYRIFDLGPNPRFYKLTGDMAEILDLTPVSYQARVKAYGAHSTVQG